MCVCTWVGVCGMALKEYRSGSITERSIDNVRVSSDPPNVSHTGKDIPRLVVKHVLQEGGGHADQTS